jgi:hypothetical protein
MCGLVQFYFVLAGFAGQGGLVHFFFEPAALQCGVRGKREHKVVLLEVFFGGPGTTCCLIERQCELGWVARVPLVRAGVVKGSTEMFRGAWK